MMMIITGDKIVITTLEIWRLLPSKPFHMAVAKGTIIILITTIVRKGGQSAAAKNDCFYKSNLNCVNLWNKYNCQKLG